jgi:putative MFS transporter
MPRVLTRAANADASLASLDAYQRRLLALLTLATLLEGFDAALTMVALRGLALDFGVDHPTALGAVSLLSWGAIASGFVVWLADRVGRKPALLLSLVAYGAFSLATALAATLGQYAWLQLFGRVFMVAQLSLSYVMLSEEIPAALRGRANGVLGTFAGIGAALPPLLLPTLERAGVGWRGFFVLGALPLALAPAYALALRETTLFRSARGARRRSAREALRALARDLARLGAHPLGGRLAAASAFWFTLSFWSGGVLVSFFAFVQAERGWSSAQVAAIPWGSIPAGIAGYLLAGVSMDRIGRRATGMLYLAGSALATIATYQATGAAAIFGAYCAVTAFGGAWTVANTVTAELFPTPLRATASGISASLLGRLGFVIGPLAAAAAITRLGDTADALSLLALLNVACIAIVWRWIPETRGSSLAS